MRLSSGEKKLITVVASIVIVGILVVILGSNMVETVNKGEYQIRQWPWTGTVDAKMDAGMWPQCFSSITVWPKARTFYFTSDKEEGENRDQSIEVRFNEGSLCDISGSCRIKLPVKGEDAVALIEKHGYKTYEEFEQELILKVVRNALRLTGNMMTARESYAEKRGEFLFWAWDQVQNGLYQTEDVAVETIDLKTGEKTTRVVKRIKIDPKTGEKLRMKNSLEGLGIELSNFDIKKFNYRGDVTTQIATQQKAYMDIETERANAAKARQDAKTAESEGLSNVTKAEYKEKEIAEMEIVAAKQEKETRVITATQEKEVAEEEKVRALIKANKDLTVATIGVKEASETRQKLIFEGQGEAQRKALVLAADGALAEKLKTYLRVQEQWAAAYAQRKVPTTVLGGADGAAQGGESKVMTMLTLLAAEKAGVTIAKDVPAAPKK
jgi:hypothetical protein